MRKLIAILAVAIVAAACTPKERAMVIAQYKKDHPPVVILGPAISISRDPGYDFLLVAAALHNDPFLACTRAHESDTAGGYTAYNPGGPYYGAYQYLQGTWNWAAAHYGAPQYVGADIRTVPGFWQDLVTLNYYHAGGNGPWGGRC